MKYKLILLSFFTLIFLSGCTNTAYYVEPLGNKNAKLFVDRNKLLANYAFPLEIVLRLDNAIINENQYPKMSVLVSEGKHILSMDIITFYFGGREKFNTTKAYEINFKANETYEVSAKIDEERLKEKTDDVEASYFIKSKDINIKEKLVLEDSSFINYNRSPEHNAIISEATNAVIQTVVLPLF